MTGFFVSISAAIKAVYSVLAATGASLIGFVQQGTGAVLRTIQDKFKESVSLKDYGAIEDGVADDTAATIAAINHVAGRIGGGVVQYEGTPLIKSTVTVPNKVSLRASRSSYFVKHSSVVGPAILITGNTVRMENGGVIGQAGNTGDGIQIVGRGVTLSKTYTSGCGGKGIRVGSDVAGKNANLFFLDNVTSSGNGEHGIYVHDKPGAAPDACGGTILQPDTANNGGDGVRFGNSAFNTVIGGAFQNNGGYGIRYEEASETSRFGGDSEMNTTGDVYISEKSYRIKQFGNRSEEVTVDKTATPGYNKNRFNRTQNYGNRIANDNPRNWPFVVSTTGVTNKTITGITVVGTTATATCTSHGYAVGDTFFTYPNITGQNPADTPFSGSWSVASVIDANTFAFTLPDTTYPAVASETYASFVGYPLGGNADGDWRIEDGWVTFSSWLRLNVGAKNAALTGDIVIYGLPLRNTKGSQKVQVDAYFVANMLNYVPLAYIPSGAHRIQIGKIPAAAAAAAAVNIPVADLAINANSYLSIAGRYRAI